MPASDSSSPPAGQRTSLRNKLSRTGRLILITLGLMILPAMALFRMDLDVRWVAAYVLIINLFTFLTYARDKKRAEEGTWRVAESRLHLLELVGGWPAAFCAQQLLRHKSSKVSYRIVFWIIVGAYQLVAFDALMDWRISGIVIDSIDLILKQGD